MTELEKMDFLDVFGQLDDPRIDRKKLHPMPANVAVHFDLQVMFNLA